VADPATLPSGRRLLRQVIPPLTTLIDAAQREPIDALGNTSGRRAPCHMPIQLLDAQVMAMTTVVLGPPLY
jgi:hypothetical protein